MADIVSSRTKDQNDLMTRFKAIVKQVDTASRKTLLSPITITLGDEFQCVASSLSSALKIIISLEEIIVKKEAGFKLRYVLLEGEIATPINPEIAYEMLGSGLTEARELLAELKKAKNRICVKIRNEKRSNAINDAFVALQDITDDWKLKKDYYIVAKFLESGDYKQVAIELNKERSLMWKRGKSLRIEAYMALKNVINYLGKN
jgi:hypothetical protein